MPNSTLPSLSSYKSSAHKRGTGKRGPQTHKNFSAPAYLVAFTISTALYVWFSFISSTTVYESVLPFIRSEATSGSWWQWISGHFMHSNFIHYFMNMIGLGLLWMLHGEYASVKSFTLNYLIIAFGVSLGIYFFSPQLMWYVGMSAVLHGLFAWGVVIDIYFKRKTGYLLLLGLIIKLCDEHLFSSSSYMADLIEVDVAVDAHLFGAVIGLILGIIWVVTDVMNIRKSM